MTERYIKGKIYSIRSPQTDKYYIGSTCLELCKRLYAHRKKYEYYLNKKYHYTTAFEIIKYEDHYIELIEVFACNSKAELEKREGELHRLYKDEIINCRIEGRNRKEREVANKEIIKENNKIYRDMHKEQAQLYYDTHKQEIKEYKKQYNIKNREKIKQYKLDKKQKDLAENKTETTK